MKHFFFCALLICSTFFAFCPTESATDRDMNQKVGAIPIFVFNQNGAAISDLKAEELELYINDNKIPITQLVHEDQAISGQNITNNATAKTNIAIILDFYSLSLASQNRMQEIASEIVKAEPVANNLKVFALYPQKGLKLIAADENDRVALQKKVAAISKWPPYDSDGKTPYIQALQNIKNIFAKMNQPKIAYIISSGSGFASFMSLNQSQLYKDSIFAQNGILLFTIDPSENVTASFKNRAYLQMSASAAGGDYIRGRDIDKMVAYMKKSNAAYYIAAFDSTQLTADQNKIQLHCLRHDSVVHTPAFY